MLGVVGAFILFTPENTETHLSLLSSVLTPQILHTPWIFIVSSITPGRCVTSQWFSLSPLGPKRRCAAALRHPAFCRVDAGNNSTNLFGTKEALSSPNKPGETLGFILAA